MMNTLLNDIDAFLVRHDMAPTTFGERAVNDGKLVFQLRDGRRVWPETADKVRAFMAQADREANTKDTAA